MHWHLSKGAEGKRAADVSGGKYGLQMTGAGPGKTVHFMQGDIPVKAGTEYQLSVRFKGRKDTLSALIWKPMRHGRPMLPRW